MRIAKTVLNLMMLHLTATHDGHACSFFNCIFVVDGVCLKDCTIAPVSHKVEGCSGETIEMSKATHLPRFQCACLSTGRDCE